MSPRAAAHLRLVSDAHISRHFDTLPDAEAARTLLHQANARASAGAPPAISRRPLWIYGAGELGKRALAHFTLMGQDIAGVLDEDPASYADDPDWSDVSLLTPEAAPQEARTRALVAIAVVDAPYTPLEAELNRLGWLHCMPLYDLTEISSDRQPFGDGWAAPRLGPTELDVAETVLAGFGDDASRAHYLRFAAWRLARQEWDFEGAPVEPETRFFIPELTRALRPGERALDAGAHHGATMARLIELTGGAISTLWAVEPDPDSRAALQAHVDGLDLDLRARIQILDAVLGARAEAVRFHCGLGQSSRISPSGRTLRAAIPLDALSLDPSFVKLHLEGAELDTLMGSRHTLLRHRPIIAAAVHHDTAGLTETPSWLMRELPDYTFLMRTHGWCGTDAVVYAIPKERSAP